MPELRLPVPRAFFYDRWMAEPCTARLGPGEVLRVEPGTRILCCAGIVDVDGRRLRAGESITVQSRARLTALGGMRDEWLDDSGLAVVYLSDA